LRHCATNRKVTGSLTYYGPGGDSDSNRNEYQEYFLREVKMVSE
jgi:hypothetical protein